MSLVHSRRSNPHQLEWSAGAAGPLIEAEDRIALTWKDRGLCAEVGPDLFFPERGDNVARARLICRRCEVRVQCVSYALGNGEPWGIWGGLTERELRAERGAREAGVVRAPADILAEADARYLKRRDRAARQRDARYAAERAARAGKARGLAA